MGEKRGQIKQFAGSTGLDLNLQDIVDIMEDELLVIDSEYRVRFARLAGQGIFRKRTESSPIGRLCYEVFHGRDRPCGAPLWDCPLEKVMESGSITTVVHPVSNLGTTT